MNKEQKAAAVEEIAGKLKDAEAVFAIDYRGISVPQAAELRTGLREADAAFNVVKNRLTLRAADAAGAENLKDHLTGPTALTFVNGDVALAAKTLSKLGEEWELLEFKGGIMGDDVLDADKFKGLAKLPGRDQLNAQFAGIVASPLTGLVRGLGSMVQGLALQLQAIADQGLVTGEAPADSPAGGGDDTASESGDAAAEDGSSGGEADAPDASDDDAPDTAAENAEEGDPDPEPTDSPEEEPSEEQAPPDDGDGKPDVDLVEGGGEGDADIGEGDAGESSESEQAGEDTEPSTGADAGDSADGGDSDTSEGSSDEEKENE